MAAMAEDWKRLARRLADALVVEGSLTDPAWTTAVSATPRHVFVPRFYNLDTGDRPVEYLDETLDRDAWLAAIYQDQPLVTRYAVAGIVEGVERRIPTSSSSMPSVVTRMLEAAAISDGHRVLEIGTGTGYNAALLCARLGDHLVSSVDIDPDLVATAAERLAGIGYSPRLAVGDGADGWRNETSAAERFDRIIATCAVNRIPPAWVDQLALGGRLVTPLGNIGGALVVLDKTSDHELVGRFAQTRIYFIPMRSDVTDPRGPLDFSAHEFDDPRLGTAYRETTVVDPAELFGAEFQLWLELEASPLTISAAHDDRGNRTATIVRTPTGWARAEHLRGERGWLVRQRGQHPWNAIEAAWCSWVSHDRPGRDRLGITATNLEGEQYVWLDRPSSHHRWPLPLGTPRGPR